MAKPIVLIVAAAGFQPMEYQETKSALEKGNLEVITASDSPETAVASDNVTHVKVDVSLSDLKVDDYDGIFLIGGPGALEHLNNKPTIAIMKQATKQNIPRGAICISPRIMAEAGLLKGIRATGWNDDNKLPAIFAQYEVIAELEKPVVTDGRVITANGPRAAQQFGQAIVKSVVNYRNQAS